MPWLGGRIGVGQVVGGTDQRRPWTLRVAEPLFLGPVPLSLCRSLPLPPLYQIRAPRPLARWEWGSLLPRAAG